MTSKHTCLLFLIFIVHASNAMENNKKIWSVSQMVTNFFQRCQAERVSWRQGYMSHAQQIYPNPSILRTTSSISPFIQKSFTEQDMQTYLLINNV